MAMRVLSSPEVEDRNRERFVMLKLGEVRGKRRCLMSEDGMEVGLRGSRGCLNESDMVGSDEKPSWEEAEYGA